MSRLTPEEAEERECMAEDRAKGKKEDALIESGIVERFLRGGCKSATFPGGQLLTRDEHKVIFAHILYLQQQTDVDKDLITQYQRQVKDLTEQLVEKDRLLADPTLGRLVPIDVQAALDAAIQDSEDVDANT